MDLNFIKILIVVLIILFAIYLFSSNEYFSLFPSPLIYDTYIDNRNSFRNYYRIGYEKSANLGWKPDTTWDYLQPESNEAPECFPEEGRRTLPVLLASSNKSVNTYINGISNVI